MKTLSFLTLRTASIVLLLASALPATNAADLTATKFFGKWTDPDPESYGIDLVIAASEKWIVAGFYNASEQAAKQGALQVFNAVTGAWVRKVLPPTGATPGVHFGRTSLAISGDLAVATASGIGRAYIISLPTGKILRTLIPTDPDPNAMGGGVAISGSRVIIGSPTYSNLQGAAYIFDLNTGLQLAKLTASGGAPDDLFGSSVAAEGNVAVITAPYVNAARGTGYLFDLTTFAQISKLQPSASMAGDHVGESVAIHQGKVVLGAPDADAGKGKIFVINLNDGSQRTLSLSDAVAPDRLGLTICLQHGLLIAGCPNKNDLGKVYAFDLNSGESTEFDQIEPPDSDSSVFGLQVALCGNTVYASTVLDDTQAENAGAFWRFRYIAKPMPLTKVTAKGDSANGAVNINYKSFSSAFINSSSECMISGSLAGSGSNANKDIGIWSTLGYTKSLDLVAKTRDPIDLGTISSVSSPMVNSVDTAIFRASMAGPGITSINNQGIYLEDGDSATRLFRTGEALPSLNQARASNFPFMVQSRSINASRLALSYVLRQGIASTDATNDTGILWSSLTNLSTEGEREGALAGVNNLTYGQFSGRVASFDSHILYTAANTGPAAVNQTLFQKDLVVNPVVVANKGMPAPSALGANFSAFIGETLDDSETALYRASITGGTTTPATNEGLWTRTTANVHNLVYRKGDTVPGTGGAKIAKFIHFWEAYEQTMVLVQLNGTGVTAANDQALLLYQTTNNVQGITLLLMREGDPAPGCVPAKIGTISRVEVEPFGGHYLVLATLVGAPAGTDLALFRGLSHKTLVTAVEQTLRRPVPVLRKGLFYDNQPSRVKSISLPTTNMTASGAGGVGLGRAIQETSTNTPKDVIITVIFDNGVVQVMKGTP